MGAFDVVHNGDRDAFVVKLAANGAALTYATFLGGGSSQDFGTGIAVDALGAAYVTGFTQSAAFPVTDGAFDTTLNGGYGDGFVAKLVPAGSALDYSAFLGGAGHDEPQDIATDGNGAAYVTGMTTSFDFPVTPGVIGSALLGSSDAFVVKVSLGGDALAYATYLGDSRDEDGWAIAVVVPGLPAAGSTPTLTGLEHGKPAFLAHPVGQYRCPAPSALSSACGGEWEGTSSAK